MNIITKIKRHAAIASSNFNSIFKDVEIPPLPAFVTRLLAEFNQPEPNIANIVKLLSSTTGISAKLIKMANSALFSLQRPVMNVKDAVTLLGFRQVQSIVLAYSIKDTIPKTGNDLFNHDAFWTDSLLQAILTYCFAGKKNRLQQEDVFTAALLSDVALPILLSSWTEYYAPVVEEWKHSQKRLSEIERQHFGWDHGQAGAWIAQSWKFPEEMLSCHILLL